MSDYTSVASIQSRGVLLYSEQEIGEAIDRIAAQMNEQLAESNPIFICVMNGALIFTGQLLPKLKFPLQLDYIHVTRYQGEIEGGNLHWLSEPKLVLENRTVVLLEDILDTGITLAAIRDYCEQKGAKEVLTAAMIDKQRPRTVDNLETTDFTGLKVEDKFLIGYGLDYQGFLRNLPGIYAVETAE